MIPKSNETVVAKGNVQTFIARQDRDIRGILDQLERRRHAGFPFSTAAQMNKQTELRDVRVLLDLADSQVEEMGQAYGDALRFLLYRDIYEQLDLFLQYIQLQIPESSRVRAFTP